MTVCVLMIVNFSDITFTLHFVPLFLQLQCLMKENKGVPEIEKLNEHEFDLDIQEQFRLQAEGETEVERVRIYIYFFFFTCKNVPFWAF